MKKVDRIYEYISKKENTYIYIELNAFNFKIHIYVI